MLIVHPVEGFKADDVDEYAEPEEVKPDPDRFVPSGQQRLIIDCNFPAYNSTQTLAKPAAVDHS